jgi:enolase
MVALGRAAVPVAPAPVSTAWELRDGDKKCYAVKAWRAVRNVNEQSPAYGFAVTDQADSTKTIELDGTNKNGFGAERASGR